MAYEKDFPHLTSTPLALPMSTFFEFNYVETGKLKLEVPIVC